MLAHTSLRHIMLSTQFAIGVVLLSAAYLTHDHSELSGSQLKADSQLKPAIEKPLNNSERC